MDIEPQLVFLVNANTERSTTRPDAPLLISGPTEKQTGVANITDQ